MEESLMTGSGIFSFRVSKDKDKGTNREKIFSLKTKMVGKAQNKNLIIYFRERKRHHNPFLTKNQFFS